MVEGGHKQTFIFFQSLCFLILWIFFFFCYWHDSPIPHCVKMNNCIDIYMLLGRSLMIGWRKNSWNHERVPTVVTFVSVCVVCPRVTGHTFWPRNLIFGLSDPWDMRKKRIFFRNFHFYAFHRDFSIFSLYNTNTFFVSSYQSQFFT